MSLRIAAFLVGVSILASPGAIYAANTKSISLTPNAYLTRSNNFNLTTGTIETWMKWTSLPQGNSSIGSNLIYSGTQGIDFTINTDGQLMAFLGAGTGSTLTSVGSVPSGEWHHVAVAWNTTSATIYIDGVAAQNSTSWGTMSAGNANFDIGFERVTTRYYGGYFDDYRIWNTKRTQAEIANNKNTELVGNETGLVAYWRFNDAYTDATSNARTLSTSGSPAFSTDIPTWVVAATTKFWQFWDF